MSGEGVQGAGHDPPTSSPHTAGEARAGPANVAGTARAVGTGDAADAPDSVELQNVDSTDASRTEARTALSGPYTDLGPVAVVIPTYNERENVEEIVGRLRSAAPYADVLVVDDASPDGTGDLAAAMASGDDQLHLLRRSGKRGLGAAYIAGFRWVLRRGYDVVVEMDADGSHQPEELPRLLDALRYADLVVGSRWVREGRVLNWSPARAVLSRGGNTYTRFALGIPLTDSTGGFRAYRSHTLENIGLEDVESQGYCFQVDLAVRALRRGSRVVEVPITFVERSRGASKMSRDIVVEALWRITSWGVRTRAANLSRWRRKPTNPADNNPPSHR